MDRIAAAPLRRHRRPTAATIVMAVTAATIVALVAAVVLAARPAGGQPPSEPVPCEVAMVVGCVASVSGPEGSVPLVLQVTDPDGPAAEAATGDQPEGDTSAQEPAPADDAPVRSGVDPWERGGLRSNFGTDSIPISHYQIGADVTGWLGVPDPLDSFVASQTNWAFTTSTFLVILATNALDWAFEFPLAEELIGQAGVLAQSYTVDLLGFGLATSIYSLALTATMIIAGFKAVTKGLIAAGGDAVPAIAAYVLLTVLTLTAGFGDAGLTVARVSSDLSSSIARFAVGAERQDECARAVAADPADGEEAAGTVSSACSFGFALQRSLVELPYQNLQWGQTLDGVAGKERCAELNRELLAEGPWGNDDEPRDRMRSADQCAENADFNHQASYIRLGIASANTVTTSVVTLLLLVIAAMLLWQQVKLLALTVTMPHALVLAILPGRPRQLAWQWAEHLVGVIIRTVILSLGLVVWLSLFSLIVHEQLTARGVFVSLFASVAMAVSGFYALYRLNGLTRRGDRSSGSGRRRKVVAEPRSERTEPVTTRRGRESRPARTGGGDRGRQLLGRRRSRSTPPALESQPGGAQDRDRLTVGSAIRAAMGAGRS